MSETRYNEKYIYPEDLPPKDRIPANATIEYLPYEVSDEELQAEADDARLKETANMPVAALKVPILAESIKLLCKKLGFD